MSNRKRNFKGSHRPGDRGVKKSYNSKTPRQRSEISMRSEDVGNSSLNDIGWYARNPELLASAARIPFPYRPGMRLPACSMATPISYPAYECNDYLPGVMTLKFGYSIGYSEDVTSAASIAAKELWSKVRSKFSADLPIDPPDLLMYCMALDQIHAYIAYLKRLYRALNVWDKDNRNLPDLLLRAMHPGMSNDTPAGYLPEEVEELRGHMPLFWNRINTLVHMVNKYVVPNDMDIYKRHRWMNENVYLDSPSAASRMYVFVPAYFYEVDDDEEDGTTLRPIIFNSSVRFTVDSLYTFGLHMVDKLSSWEDSYTINGYLQRAFEGSEFYSAELLSEDERLTGRYIPEVLTQIQNFEGIGAENLEYSSLVISQDPTTNSLIHKPVVRDDPEEDIAWMKDNHVLVLDSDAPTAADVTIATRLKAVIEERSGGSIVNRIIAATEIPLSTWIFHRYWNDGSPRDEGIELHQCWRSGTRDSAEWYADILRGYFHYAPIAYRGFGQSTALPPSVGGIHVVATPGNITMVSDEALREINRVCAYSEFNVFS